MYTRGINFDFKEINHTENYLQQKKKNNPKVRKMRI